MKLSDETYKTCIKSIPIICVDLVVKINGKYLLLKRLEEPLKDEWWVPGGRILRGESVKDAVHRKLLEETGLKAISIEPIGFYEDVFDFGHGVRDYHSISLVFDVVSEEGEVTIDATSSDWTLSDELPQRFIIKQFYE